jgi:hypothetical protein
MDALVGRDDDREDGTEKRSLQLRMPLDAWRGVGKNEWRLRNSTDAHRKKTKVKYSRRKRQGKGRRGNGESMASSKLWWNFLSREVTRSIGPSVVSTSTTDAPPWRRALTRRSTAMDITKYIADYREAAFLVGDYSTYRGQLSRRLRIVRKKLGRATAKNAKYTAKTPVTAEEIGQNVEYA